MAKRVLITGGAGFIGTHVAKALLAGGWDVRALDCLLDQVHDDAVRAGAPPDNLDPAVDLRVGDVRDPRTVADALRDVDAVIHLAARVGVGQSMYRIADYVSGNDLGTAVLLEALRARPVGRLVVASSMSIYGEGLYRDADGRTVDAGLRDAGGLAEGRWDPVDAHGRPLVPIPTPESKPPNLASVYALGKYVQERMCLVAGAAFGLPTVALRFFNVFGRHQALSNPYTGVIANFAVRLRAGRAPLLFEDGRQRRDFLHVRDAARACVLALDAPEAPGRAYNIGSGRSIAIGDMARLLAAAMDRPDLEPATTGGHRVGDVRHCFADPSLAADVLGFRAEVALEDGLSDLVAWLPDAAGVDRIDDAHRELQRQGLTR